MNIFKIQENLYSIFGLIEENGGEITPEIEACLAITQDEFESKVEDYTNVIKSLNFDINLIKNEQKRLKDLADRKQKIIDKLNKILIDAIDNFGSTKKTGVKFVDYGTGIVSIRQTKAVEVDTELLKDIEQQIKCLFEYSKATNQLDVEDRLHSENLIDAVNGEHLTPEGLMISGHNITENDLNHTNIKLTVKLPSKTIFDGESYPVIKEILKHCSDYELEAGLSKSEVKKELEENGSCIPNLARLVTNKSIQIK